MTSLTDRRELLTVWQRRLFYVWITAALIAVIDAMFGGPIASTDETDGTMWVALISPAAMFIFLLTGFTWLVMLVLSHRSKYLRHPPD